MGKGMVILGRTDTGSPTPATAEDAAQEYFVNRRLAGIGPPALRLSGGTVISVSGSRPS
jgi:hypothetical protein